MLILTSSSRRHLQSLPFLLSVLLLALLALPATSHTLKINAGDKPFHGFISEPSSWIVGGTTYAYIGDNKSQPIAHTDLRPVLQSHRWSFQYIWGYDIPVNPGVYTLTLKWAEVWPQGSEVGARVFDVLVGSNAESLRTVESGLDVFAKVGSNAMYQRVVPHLVLDDRLVLRFVKRVQNSMISAIVLDRVGDHPKEKGKPRAEDDDNEDDEGHRNGVLAIAPVDFASLGKEHLVTKLNVGGPAVAGFEAETAALFPEDGPTGGTVQNISLVPVTNAPTSTSIVFVSHRYGAITWKIKVPKPRKYIVSLLFAEILPEFQRAGVRLFGIQINGKVAETKLDVFSEVGPAAALVKSYLTDATDSISVSLLEEIGDPILCGIVIVDATSNVIIAPLAPSRKPLKSLKIPFAATGVQVLKVNLGAGHPVAGFHPENSVLLEYSSGGTYVDPNLQIAGAGSSLRVYQSHRYGEFRAELPVPASGIYTVTLLFTEINKDMQKVGGRLFNITLDGVVVESSFDIFKLAGANAALTRSYRLTTEATIISLSVTSVSGPPLVCGVIVSSGNEVPLDAQDVSIQNPKANSGFDHRAHAVSKGPYIVTDFDGDGLGSVVLNADGSHTHYFKPGDKNTPAVSGRLVYYEWKNLATGVVLAKGSEKEAEVITATFPLGTTPVELTVIDNTGSVASESTTVTVLDSSYAGAYCYFYDYSDRDVPENKIPIGPGNSEKIKPTVSASVKNISFHSIDDFPGFSFKDGQWAMRCVGNLLLDVSDEYTFHLRHHGPIAMYIDGKSVVCSKCARAVAESAKSLSLSSGLSPFEILYFKPLGKQPQAVLEYVGGLVERRRVVPSTSFSYTPVGILPMIKSLSPAAAFSGGGLAIIKGAGFFDDVALFFDDVRVTEMEVVHDSEIHFIVPKSKTLGIKTVTIVTKAGVSNQVTFEYSVNAPQAVKFRERRVVRNETEMFFPMLTSIKMGPDGKIYVGSLRGLVYILEVDKNHNVQSMCESERVGKGRAILGIGFNYKTAVPNVYTSTNSLYWKDKNDSSLRWDNGKVEMMVPNNDTKKCLLRSETVISGLPVSNHDHAVNDLLFTDEGDLLVLVGGSTNAGVSIPSDKIGGVPDSPLSGAMLIAYLSKPDFDGKIIYDQYDDPEKANVVSPSTDYIEIYATGLRNSFTMVLGTNDMLYATDNGPNKGFGAISTSCTTSSSEINYPDHLMYVEKGDYFGYPNRNRGRKQPGECIYRNYDDRNAFGFKRPMSKIESSASGLVQYTARTFGGQLKGELVASKPAYTARGLTSRATLDATGKKLVGSITTLFEASGVCIMMNAYGALYMPRVYQGHIVVLEPEYEPPESKSTLIAVSPMRGPAAGGNRVLITGHNFGSSPIATFGGKECTNISNVASDGTSFTCVVPPAATPKARVQVVVNGIPGSAAPGPAADNVDYMYTT